MPPRDTPGPTQLLRQLEAAFWLRPVNKLGVRAHVTGRPYVHNAGRIRIGRDFRFVSRPAVSHLVAMEGSSIEIGDRVQIGCGASISSHLRLRIGDDTRIGPYVVIMDSDIHVVGDRSAHAIPQPVWIGSGVVIGHRVTVLRGSTLGDGVRVESGSVVAGDVPDGAVVAGVPAGLVLERTEADASNTGPAMSDLVQRVFGLATPPAGTDGPDTIARWDSLGSLRLLLAIEQAFGVSIRDADLRGVGSVEALSAVVNRARLERSTSA